MSFLKKAVTGIRGTPEQREERKQQEQVVAKARNESYQKGRIAGAKQAAYESGVRAGRQQGAGSPGFLGTLDSTVKGLNRVESAFGFDRMFQTAPQPQQPQQRKKRRENNDPWGVGLP